ncbi:hypothetical protein EVAR_9303_1 [Eumeta japonica]|uniref:Uncharacterized protein n=1 Tax=Eumeta variegata TaxID=151549 RepID=A0A4C1TN15_EUMVA|nr:hypothetical protein EVAR_9303_1 [Eumeta japonica]
MLNHFVETVGRQDEDTRRRRYGSEPRQYVASAGCGPSAQGRLLGRAPPRGAARLPHYTPRYRSRRNPLSRPALRLNDLQLTRHIKRIAIFPVTNDSGLIFDPDPTFDSDFDPVLGSDLHLTFNSDFGSSHKSDLNEARGKYQSQIVSMDQAAAASDRVSELNAMENWRRKNNGSILQNISFLLFGIHIAPQFPAFAKINFRSRGAGGLVLHWHQ